MTSISNIINRQLLRWEYQKKQLQDDAVPRRLSPPPPVVTVSRQKGSRGSYFGRRLAEQLGYSCLHREVIDAICESSGYLKRIVESLDESFRNDLELMVESLFLDQSVDHQDYIRHLYRVVLSLSSFGGVLLIGRSGNFILGPDRGFHIRVVASLSSRIENLRKYENLSENEAVQAIEASDSTREQFARKLFDKQIGNAVHYDQMINTTSVDVEDLVRASAILIRAKFEKQAAKQTRRART